MEPPSDQISSISDTGAPAAVGGYLLKFQIGPVQDFIAQARSTRDLWSGSYLLSWLVAAGIRKALELGGILVFPTKNGQMLLSEPFDLSRNKEILTPNLPNVFVVEMVAEPRSAARDIEAEIRDEWRKIAGSVWEEGESLCLDSHERDRFFAQVDRQFSISWVATPKSGKSDGDYAVDFRNNATHLDAVRQTRNFPAWATGGWGIGFEKDSLSGREEAIAGGKDWLELVQRKELGRFFKHPDYMGAVSLIKRVWHWTYLKKTHHFRTDTQPGGFQIPSTRGIACRDRSVDADENVDVAEGDRYLAAIVFDGDRMGEWIDGRDLPAGRSLRDHQEQISSLLSEFANHSVQSIVETEHGGFVIYAGGDDVIALVPAEEGLRCAYALRQAYVEKLKGIVDKQGRSPDASAGVAVAHFKSPLQDLLQAARDSERRAKNDVGRHAFALTLQKRSGEIDLWDGKWDDKGPEVFERMLKGLNDGDLSNRFSSRVCELLSPYLKTGRRKDVPGFPATEIVLREFESVFQRQGKEAMPPDLVGVLTQFLDRLPGDPQTIIASAIGLTKAVAFVRRNQPNPKS